MSGDRNEAFNLALNPNKGLAFTNNSKTGNQPDYTGQIRVTMNGIDVQVDIAHWFKKTKKGKWMISSNITLPDEQITQQPRPDVDDRPPIPDEPDPDEDLPF